MPQFKAEEGINYKDPVGRTYTGTGDTVNPAADWLASSFKPISGGRVNPSQMRPEDRIGIEGYDEKGYAKTDSYKFDVFGNPVGNINNMPINTPAFDVSAESQPLFATNLDQFGESADAQARRYAMLEEQGRIQEGRAKELGAKAEGGVSGKFTKGSRSGVGYDSIKDEQIQQIKKDTANTIKDIWADVNKAKVDGDWAAEDRAMAKMQLALDVKDQADRMALDQARLKLDALIGETNAAQGMYSLLASIPTGKSFEYAGKIYESIATESADPFFKGSDIAGLMKELPVGQSKTITDPNTGYTYTVEGVSNDAGNQTFRSVNEANGDETFLTLDQGGNIINTAVSKGTGQRWKPSSSSSSSGDESKFDEDIREGQQDLTKGLSWGQTWNRLYNQYATGNPEQDAALAAELDESLGKEQWSKPGAYNDFEAAGKTSSSGGQLILPGGAVYNPGS